MILSTFLVCVNAQDGIEILIDEAPLVFDVPPMIINDRTMVPLRAIFQAIGAEVTWNNETNTVTAQKGNIIMKITVGQDNMTVNEATIPLDSPACIIEGRTLVPIRAITESFGLAVNWNDETKTVSIATPPEYDENYLVEKAILNLALPVRDTITHRIKTEYLPAIGEWVARVYFYEDGIEKAKYTWCLDSDQHYGGYSDFE